MRLHNIFYIIYYTLHVIQRLSGQLLGVPLRPPNCRERPPRTFLTRYNLETRLGDIAKGGLAKVQRNKIFCQGLLNIC